MCLSNPTQHFPSGKTDQVLDGVLGVGFGYFSKGGGASTRQVAIFGFLSCTRKEGISTITVSASAL